MLGLKRCATEPDNGLFKWLTPVIPAFERLKQGDQEFSLDFVSGKKKSTDWIFNGLLHEWPACFFQTLLSL